MSRKLHGYKVGQCLRLRKYEFAKNSTSLQWDEATNRLQIKTLAKTVYDKMASLRKAVGEPDYDPNAPSYTYLKLTKVVADRLVGVDLLTLKVRGLEWSGNRWTECDPTDPHNIRKIMDFWGFDEVVVLSNKDVREVVNKQRQKLDKIACCAQENAQTYRSKTAAMVRSL